MTNAQVLGTARCMVWPSPPLVIALALLSVSGAACAIGGAFTMSPQEQAAAEDWAITGQLVVDQALDRAPSRPGVARSEWAGGDCRWTWEVDVAECRTASRAVTGGPWVPAKRRYKHVSYGVWELLIP